MYTNISCEVVSFDLTQVIPPPNVFNFKCTGNIYHKLYRCFDFIFFVCKLRENSSLNRLKGRCIFSLLTHILSYSNYNTDNGVLKLNFFFQENFLHSGISALLDSESWRETGKAGGRERPRDMEKRARAGNKPGLLQQGLSLNTWYALY